MTVENVRRTNQFHFDMMLIFLSNLDDGKSIQEFRAGRRPMNFHLTMISRETSRVYNNSSTDVCTYIQNEVCIGA